MPLVVGLSGSPRANRNTDTIVNEVLRGARDAGAETKFIHLADHSIRPCSACYACKSFSGCVTKDSMQGIYRLLKQADAWVFGTPVYWFTMSGWLKAPVDRLFAFAMDPKGCPAQGKRAAVITVSGDAHPAALGKPIFATFERSFEYLGVEFAGRLALQGVDRDVQKHWAGNVRARRLGKRLVK